MSYWGDLGCLYVAILGPVSFNWAFRLAGIIEQVIPAVQCQTWQHVDKRVWGHTLRSLTGPLPPACVRAAIRDAPGVTSLLPFWVWCMRAGVGWWHVLGCPFIGTRGKGAT